MNKNKKPLFDEFIELSKEEYLDDEVASERRRHLLYLIILIGLEEDLKEERK